MYKRQMMVAVRHKSKSRTTIAKVPTFFESYSLYLLAAAALAAYYK
jgi:hypothetical protein